MPLEKALCRGWTNLCVLLITSLLAAEKSVFQKGASSLVKKKTEKTDAAMSRNPDKSKTEGETTHG
jgi:hypothetical protein